MKGRDANMTIELIEACASKWSASISQHGLADLKRAHPRTGCLERLQAITPNTAAWCERSPAIGTR